MDENRLPTQDEVSDKAKEIGQRVFKRVTRRMLEDRDKRITQLEAEVEGLKLDLEVSRESTVQLKADQKPKIQKSDDITKLERVAAAAHELDEVASLRGDNELPQPEDDPAFWTSRMQEAWDELEEALKELDASDEAEGSDWEDDYGAMR